MKNKLVSIVAIAALVVVGAWGWSRHNSSRPTPVSAPVSQSRPAQTSPATQSDLSQPRPVDAANYTYTAPPNWDQLSKEELAKSGAESGIGHTTQPFATFAVNVSPNNPKDLKGETLSGLKKLSNFKLIVSSDATVDSKAGYKFQYSFQNQTPAKQELYVMNYKGQVFSLLFSSSPGDFDQLRSDYDKILAGFRLQ